MSQECAKGKISKVSVNVEAHIHCSMLILTEDIYE